MFTKHQTNLLLLLLLWLLQHCHAFSVSSSTSTVLKPFVPSTTTTTVVPPTVLNSPSTLLWAAASPQEDLEMTRQIILEHIRKMSNGILPDPEETLYFLDHDDDNDNNDNDNNDNDNVATVETEPSEENDSTMDQEELPTNDLMIRAARGETVERTPVWLFRQAGRHLPEYRDYKAATGRNFLQLLNDPSSVAECTLQPLRRYRVDAAILFSDILVIPQALGLAVTMPGGVGIQLPHPLRDAREVDTRLPPLDNLTADFVHDKLAHVLTAVRQIRSQMRREGYSVPLIGFSAAPFTLLYYMVGGSSRRHTEKGREWLNNSPDESQILLDKLTRVVTEYLSAQVRAGCHLLQIFEAMGMMIDETNFVRFALPCLDAIGRQLKKRHPDIPLLIFCRGACQWNDKVAALGWYNVITLDDTVNRQDARRELGENVSLQGNYHPDELIEANGKTPESVRASARQMLEEFGPQRLIANLGQGLGGKESPALVQAFVDAIHEESAALIAAAKQ